MYTKIFNILVDDEDINHLYINMANLEKIIDDNKPNYELDINNYKQLLSNIDIFYVKYEPRGLDWSFIKLWQSTHDKIINNNINNINNINNSKIIIGMIDNLIQKALNDLDLDHYLVKKMLRPSVRIPSRVTPITYNNPNYVKITCCTIS